MMLNKLQVTLKAHNGAVVNNGAVDAVDANGFTHGIIQLFIPDEPTELHRPLYLMVSVDMSNSMVETNSTNKSKVEHLYDALDNLFQLFHTYTARRVYLNLQVFHTTVEQVFSNVCLQTANVTNLSTTMRTIKPNGLTNLEAALVSAGEQISSFPENADSVHLLLTDGVVTSGEHDKNALYNLMFPCPHILLGMGVDHDAELLCHLASKTGNEYRFIDAEHNAYVVYSEIAHNIMHNATGVVKISIDGSQLYDCNTNEWGNTLHVNCVLFDQPKILHVKWNGTSTNVQLTASNAVDSVKFDCSPSVENIQVYLYRQQTQEWLYKLKQLQLKNKVLAKERAKLSQQLTAFHDEMMTYANSVDSTLSDHERLLMFMFCDDILIAHNTVGTCVGHMYASARHASNNHQHMYVCSADTIPLYPLKLHRQTNSPMHANQLYQTSPALPGNNLSPYVSLKMMNWLTSDSTVKL